MGGGVGGVRQHSKVKGSDRKDLPLQPSPSTHHLSTIFPVNPHDIVGETPMDLRTMPCF